MVTGQPEFMFTKSRMDVAEALAQLRDHTLMLAAMMAYGQVQHAKSCEECCLMIGDSIRALMRPQK